LRAELNQPPPASQPEARKGRGRKHPFKARTVAERETLNAEISRVLVGVDNMFYDIARGQLPTNTDWDTIEEIVQKCRMWMWKKSLPKYNAWRRPKVKVSTFLHKCATNFIRQERRTLMRRQRPHQGALRQSNLDVNYGGDCTVEFDIDRKVEALANDIIAHPEKYMTASQTAVFKAVVNNPDTMMKDLATQLQYARASSLSMIKRRIRERLANIDIMDIEIPGEETNADRDEG
jgi:DNA-directed RNA polymerase specialized sigma24 family protein